MASDWKLAAEGRIIWITARDAISWLNEAPEEFASFWEFAQNVTDCHFYNGLLLSRDRPKSTVIPINGMVRPCSCPPASEAGKGRQRQGARHVSDTQYRDRRDRHDIGKNSFHVVGHDARGAIVLRQKWVAWPSGGAARQYTALP